MFLCKTKDIDDTRGVTTWKKNVGRTIILECYWLCFFTSNDFITCNSSKRERNYGTSPNYRQLLIGYTMRLSCQTPTEFVVFIDVVRQFKSVGYIMYLSDSWL